MVLYKIGVTLVRMWLALTGWHVQGRENIPPNEPLLLIGNHTSFGDPVLMAGIFPGHITFIAKEAFGRRPFTRLFFGALDMLFLNKDESDLTALRVSIKRLREGRTVGIFPEGRRNRDLEISDFQPGAGYIANKAGVRVLPVAMSNSKDILRFWKRNIVVNIGKPVEIKLEGKPNQQHLAELAQELRQHVSELYEENKNLLQKRGTV